MLKFFYQHYRILFWAIVVGVTILQTIALFVYYGGVVGIDVAKFNLLMMVYGVGIGTIFPFAVTFHATKRLSQYLPHKGWHRGWHLGLMLNSLICMISWLFGAIEIFLKKFMLLQSRQQILVYVLALLSGSLLTLLIGGTIGWLAYKIANSSLRANNKA